MADLPTGTVTLLFTDIEGSTQLLQRLGSRYGDVLTEYRALLRSVFQQHDGREVDTQGDSFFVAFPRAVDAVSAATEIQRALAAHSWTEDVTIPTRMGLHTGEPQRGGEGYVGLDVHRAARIGAAGHGGQVLLSDATQHIVAHDLLAGVRLVDLGEHRLKDLPHPERVYQLAISEISTEFPPLKTLDAHPNNLPLQLTSFVGREQGIAAIRQQFLDPQVRLLTLTGPGGTGKTRLALQVAARALGDFPDGTWFVDLAPLSNPAHVAATIADALGIREAAGQPPDERTKTYLREKRLLLVLDNFEQVIGAAPFVRDLIQASGGLKVLVTSRAPLHLSSEREIDVPPLAVPEARVPLAPERLAQYEAVRLFLVRAQDVQADFAITTANAQTVSEICARLDGLPLAIELAAVRIKLLPPGALLARLTQRLKLLTVAPQDLPARQQTLRGVIDWSYTLLNEDERRLFAQLAVFVGGWTIEAAEEICQVDDKQTLDVLDGLQSLLDKNLLRRQDTLSTPGPPGADGEPRFTMLETIREYALERLVAAGEEDRIRRQHAAYFLRFVETAEPKLFSREERQWLDRLDAEHDNLRAALEWSAAQGGEGDMTLRMAAALNRFWYWRGHVKEGRSWLEHALGRTDDPLAAASSPPERQQALVLRAKALSATANLSLISSDFEAARSFCEQSLALFGEATTLAARQGRAYALMLLGTIRNMQRDTMAGRTLKEESVTLMRELGDQWGLSLALYELGFGMRMLGDYDRAAALFGESLVHAREADDPDLIAGALLDLGGVTLQQDHHSQAAALLAESLSFSQGSTSGRGSYGNVHAWALIHLAEAVRIAGWPAGMLPRRPHADLRTDDLVEEGLALIRASERQDQLCLALLEVAEIAFEEGRDALAALRLGESLTLARGWLFNAGLRDMIELYAALAAAQGRHPQSTLRAARLWGAAARREYLFATARMSPVRRSRYTRVQAAVRVALDAPAWEAALAEGEAMSIEQVVTYITEQVVTYVTEHVPGQTGGAPQPNATIELPTVAHGELPSGLTQREVDILRLLAQGLTYAQIAAHLIISPHTVNAHLRAIYGKLGVTSRSAATRFAVEQHLL